MAFCCPFNRLVRMPVTQIFLQSRFWEKKMPIQGRLRPVNSIRHRGDSLERSPDLWLQSPPYSLPSIESLANQGGPSVTSRSRPLALLGSACYPILVHRLAVYAPRFLPTLGRPHAVALHFVRRDQLTAGLTPAGVRPCWAHKQKAQLGGWAKCLILLGG